MAFDLYHALNQLNKIKRKELVLPISKRQVVVSPLSVGDDLALKTALISPVKLDKELIKLLWQHTEFWYPNLGEQTSDDDPTSPKKKRKNARQVVSDNTGGEYRKIKENEFYNTISYFDKLVLLWGIYNITYVTLGEQELVCPKCGEKYKTEVDLEDTLHDDSLVLFEPEEPFNKYTESIKIPLSETHMLDFTVCIPSMADFNRILGLVSTEELQYNLENIRSEFNTEQLMTLYTKRLAVYSKDNPAERSESALSQEILTSIRDFINIEISSKFFTEYAARFAKYSVNFYKECQCPMCQEKTRLGVDIETQFFRKQLPN